MRCVWRHCVALIVLFSCRVDTRRGVESARPLPSVARGALPSEKSVAALRGLIAPHVESFNWFLNEGIDLAVSSVDAEEMQVGEGGPRLRYWIDSVTLGRPSKSDDSIDTRLWPREARGAGLNYCTYPILTQCVLDW